MALSVDVDTIRADAKVKSDQWTAEALSFLDMLKNNASSLLQVNLPNVPDDLPSTAFEDFLLGRVDAEPDITGNTAFNASATEPGTVAVASVANPALVNIPDYNVAAPIVNLPTRPELVTPDAPEAPALADVAIPASPVLDLPIAPVLSSVVFPDAPTLSLPVFSEAAPAVLDALTLTEAFSYQDEEFDSSLIDAIRAKLRTDVDDGGYGIEVEDEDALWARARDRSSIELDSVETEVSERYATLGYDLPPGAMVAALSEARNQMEQQLNETGREIATKRADLFRANRQYAMTQGTALEQIRWQNHGFKMERALNAQRFAAEYAIAVHDAKVRDLNARTARYQAIADVYRTRLQAALTEIQIYEAEVRAAVSKQQANQIDVELYSALLDAANSKVNLFEAQTRAAGLAISIQQAKVDAYRATVQGFTAQIEGNRAQLGVYTAGIQGESVKVDIFRNEVDAYGTRVQAASVEQRSRNDQKQVEIGARQIDLQKYQALIDRHRLAIVSETARIEAILRRYTADTAIYSSAISGYEALGRVDLAEETAQIAAIQEQTRRLQTNAQIRLQASTNTLTERFQAANAGSAITTGIVEAVNSTFQALTVEGKNETTAT